MIKQLTKSKDVNFSISRLAPLLKTTQISETRFKKPFLASYELSDSGGS
jgi:hypothetical protein